MEFNKEEVHNAIVYQAEAILSDTVATMEFVDGRTLWSSLANSLKADAELSNIFIKAVINAITEEDAIKKYPNLLGSWAFEMMQVIESHTLEDLDAVGEDVTDEWKEQFYETMNGIDFRQMIIDAFKEKKNK